MGLAHARAVATMGGLTKAHGGGGFFCYPKIKAGHRQYTQQMSRENCKNLESLVVLRDYAYVYNHSLTLLYNSYQ